MKKNILIFTLLLALFGVDFLVSVFHIGYERNDLLRNILFGVGQLVTVLAGIYAVSMFGLKATTGRSLAFFTAGLFLWLIGGVVFAAYDAFGETPVFPSIADIIILLGYPLLFAGFLNEIRSGKVMLKGRSRL